MTTGPSEEIGRVELRITNTINNTAACFEHDGLLFKTILLDGPDGDCAYEVIGNWEESLCPWATLKVIEDNKKGQKTFNVELRGNGLTPHIRVLLEQSMQRANAAISSGQNGTVDMTDYLKALQAMGWSLYFRDCSIDL